MRPHKILAVAVFAVVAALMAPRVAPAQDAPPEDTTPPPGKSEAEAVVEEPQGFQRFGRITIRETSVRLALPGGDLTIGGKVTIDRPQQEGAPTVVTTVVDSASYSGTAIDITRADGTIVTRLAGGAAATIEGDLRLDTDWGRLVIAFDATRAGEGYDVELVSNGTMTDQPLSSALTLSGRIPGQGQGGIVAMDLAGSLTMDAGGVPLGDGIDGLAGDVVLGLRISDGKIRLSVPRDVQVRAAALAGLPQYGFAGPYRLDLDEGSSAELAIEETGFMLESALDVEVVDGAGRRLSFDGSLGGHIDTAGETTRFDSAVANGRAEVRAEGLDHAEGLYRDLSIDGLFDFGSTQGTVTATAAKPVAVTAGGLAPLEGRGIQAPYRMTLGQGTVIRLAPRGTRVDVEAQLADTRLTGGAGRTVALAGRMALSVDAAGTEGLEIETISVRGAQAELPFGTVTIDLDASGVSAEGGSGSLRLAVAPFSGAGLTAKSAVVTARGSLQPAGDDRLAFRLAEPGTLRLEGARMGDALVLLRPVEIPILATNPPQITMAGDASSGRIDMVLDAAPFRGRFVGNAISGRTPRLDLQARWDKDGGFRLDGLEGLGGKLDFSWFLLDGFAVTYPTRVAGATAVSVEHMRWQGVRPWTPSLHFDGTVTNPGNELAFNGRFVSPAGVVVRAAGRHDLATASGYVGLDMAPVKLGAPDGLPQGSLSPALAEIFPDATGHIGLDGRIGWNRRGLRPALKIEMQNLGVSLGGLRLQQVNTVLNVDSLKPFTTAPSLVRVGLVNMGLPLTDGRLRIHMEPGALVIEGGTMRFAGGTISTGPARVPLDGSPATLTLDVRGLEVPRFVELIPLDGLSIDGVMDGRIPLRIAGSAIRIEDGMLRARQPGVISYKPEALPAALEERSNVRGVELALGALENFRYGTLVMRVDGDVSGELDIKVHIEGANPDFFAGYPVDFDLNLSGPLVEILRNTMDAFGTAKRLRQNLGPGLEPAGVDRQ